MFRLFTPMFLFACEQVDEKPTEQFEDSRVLEVCDLQAEDDFSIDGISIEGDTLIVDVSYSEGALTMSGKSVGMEQHKDISPPEVSLHIGHNSNGDTCEGFERKVLNPYLFIASTQSRRGILDCLCGFPIPELCLLKTRYLCFCSSLLLLLCDMIRDFFMEANDVCCVSVGLCGWRKRS